MREREVLESLREEFERYKDLLEGDVRRNDTAQDVLARFLEASHTPSANISADSFEVAIRHLLIAPTFDPGAGARDALISSGQLDLIQDDELRGLLVSWEGVAEEMIDNEIAMRSYTIEILVPFLASRGVEVQRALAPTGFWRAGVVTGPDIPPRGADRMQAYAHILHDVEFRSLVGYRYWNTAGLSGEYREGLEAAEQILSLIDSELAR